MKIGTLFSGIGSPEQGAMRVYDIQHAFACEWDKFARQSFLANYSIDEAHFHKDIYDMDGTQYQGKCDILIGGSPCQAFSIAGLRKGVSDKRGELIYEYIRIVDEVKAPIIVYENVKGMLSIDKGRTIKEFVQSLRDIGYHCHYDVINSKDYGVPQNRERLFLVGFLDVELYHAFSFAPKVKLTKRLRDVLESEVDEKYYLNKPIEILTRKDEGVVGMLDIKGNESIRRVYGVDGSAACLQTMQGGMREPKIIDNRQQGNNRHYSDFCPTLAARDYKEPLKVQEPKIVDSINVVGLLDRAGDENQKRVYGDNGISPALIAGMGEGGGITPKILQQEPKIFDFTNDFNEKKIREYTDFSPTLRSERFGLAVQEPKIIQLNNPTFSQQRVYSIDGLSPTIAAGNLGGGKEPCKHLTYDYRIRKLTPRECLRLQDFPDTFKQVVSDSQLYKQAGNSMTVAVLEMIFRQIEKAKRKEITTLF